MKRPRINKANKKPKTTYVLLPEYISDKRALKGALEFKRELGYLIDQGAKDDGLLTGLNKLCIENCLDSIAKRERCPRVLNGSKFLKENGYMDDFLDDFY